MPTVRDAVVSVLQREGMTRIFSNPGSTEVSLLHDLPGDIEFILGLHEGSVIGMATGHALMSGRPALALLHTTAGLGNAVGALATARANRAPIVVVVGQQDRRHIASEPFLTGRLSGLAGDYPVSVHEPARAADVPSLVARAARDAALHQGPSLVIVPMDDWAAPYDDAVALAAPQVLVTGRGIEPDALSEVCKALDDAASPVVVTGSCLDDIDNWRALSALVEALDCPVWQESHGARAAFDQTSRRFAGHLPPARTQLRAALAPHDVVLLVGGHAFRQYLFDDGPFVAAGTRVIVLTDDARDAAMSAADLVVLGPTAPALTALARSVERRPRRDWAAAPASGGSPPADGNPTPRQVFDALAARLPSRSTVIEESPSSRRVLIDAIPAREPLSFITPAMGGLGFALPAAVGMKLADPSRPVVAIVGDGASLYNIQALWSAQKYRAGVLFVVMSNGGYAVMDRLAHAAGGDPAWPGFPEVSIATLAAGFGCPARRIEGLADLHEALDTLMPTLDDRDEPMLLDVAVTVD